MKVTSISSKPSTYNIRPSFLLNSPCVHNLCQLFKLFKTHNVWRVVDRSSNTPLLMRLWLNFFVWIEMFFWTKKLHKGYLFFRGEYSMPRRHQVSVNMLYLSGRSIIGLTVSLNRIARYVQAEGFHIKSKRFDV